MSEEEEEEIQFEYESDDGLLNGLDGEEEIDEESILLENAFYEAQDVQLSDPHQALRLYEEVAEKEEQRGRRKKEERKEDEDDEDKRRSQSSVGEVVWRFKSLLNIVLIHLRLGDFTGAVSAYERLLPLLRHVTRNEASAAINAVLEATAAASDRALLLFDQPPNSSPGTSARGTPTALANSFPSSSSSPTRTPRSPLLHAPSAQPLQTPAAPALPAAPQKPRQSSSSRSPSPSSSSRQGNERGEEEEGRGGGGGGGAEEEKEREREGERKAVENLETIFRLTLEALDQHNVKRLWLRTCSRMIKLYIHQGNFDKAESLLAGVYRQSEESGASGRGEQEEERNSSSSSFSSSPSSSTSSSGSSTTAGGCPGTGTAGGHLRESPGRVPKALEEFQGSQVLEFYSLEMSLCVARGKDFNRLRCLYTRAQKLLRQGVAEPRNAAVIQEIGGRISMAEKRWHSAYLRFSEAFRNYQAVGRVKEAKTMIQCVVLSSLLSSSNINPLDTREARALQGEAGVSVMESLRRAFDERDMQSAHKLLTCPEFGLSTDPYMSLFVSDLLRSLRLHALPSILAPYSRVSIDFLEKELQTTNPQEVFSLIHEAVSTGKIRGILDGVNGVFIHHRSREPSRPSFFSGHSSSSSLSLSTEELTEEKRRGVGGGDEKTEERGGAEEEEESEERSMKDWIDSLSSLTKSLSLASPFGGALQTL